MWSYVLVNRTAGTVLSLGEERIRSVLVELLAAAPGRPELLFVDCAELIRMLEDVKHGTADQTVIIGGGDGTVSTAAGILAGSNIALGVLPLGTMNLLCRAVGLPLDLAAAAVALLEAAAEPVDLGTVNGRVFVHHVSLGFHPKMVSLRNARGYRSRLEKMWASLLSWAQVVRQPPSIAVQVHAGVRAQPLRMRTPALIVTNNRLLRSLGSLPQPERLNGGTLELHIAKSDRTLDVINMSLAALTGRWDDTTLFETREAAACRISLNRRRVSASVDGELTDLHTPLVFESLPGALKLLQPPRAERVAVMR
ncbi:diacylglycerol/lipid kinase family protein [Rhodoligotrophos defluvii]|uniref:diacylglycerol/lipid kinase family protein n=1 Tax=Rhodoligotrophos defluvii TaxID=2561934 RepID=UPI0010CA0653|nr:diacylglycerol kinase family protein [Rhodoligotrophos defluvii]